MTMNPDDIAAQLEQLNHNLTVTYNRAGAHEERGRDLATVPGRDARAYEAGYLSVAIADVRRGLAAVIAELRVIRQEIKS